MPALSSSTIQFSKTSCFCRLLVAATEEALYLTRSAPSTTFFRQIHFSKELFAAFLLFFLVRQNPTFYANQFGLSILYYFFFQQTYRRPLPLAPVFKWTTFPSPLLTAVNPFLSPFSLVYYFFFHTTPFKPPLVIRQTPLFLVMCLPCNPTPQQKKHTSLVRMHYKLT